MQRLGKRMNLRILAGEEVSGAEREHRPEPGWPGRGAGPLHGLAPPQLIHALRLGARSGIVHNVQEQVLEAVAWVARRRCVRLPYCLQLFYGCQIWLRWKPCEAVCVSCHSSPGLNITKLPMMRHEGRGLANPAVRWMHGMHPRLPRRCFLPAWRRCQGCLTLP